MKRTIAGGAVVIALVAVLSPAQAEPRGMACNISGSVSVKPGLKSPAPGYLGGEYKVKITGEYTDCHGSGEVPGSGSLTAIASGEGTCVYRSIEGITKVKWDNGNETTFEFSTNDEAAIAVFTTTATKSTEPAMQEGDQGVGLIAFDADPTECNTPEGATAANFEGVFVAGSPG